jgi:predicted RNA binding protein YcfA (HicA-like mRNA interferase family)
MTESIRYGDLTRLLERLGFVCWRVEGSHLNCENTGADALIMLPGQEAGAAVRPRHLVAMRRYLDEKGLLSRDDFDLWAAEITLAANGSPRPQKPARSEAGKPRQK